MPARYGEGGYHPDGYGAGGYHPGGYGAYGSVNRGELNGFLGLPTDAGLHAAGGTFANTGLACGRDLPPRLGLIPTPPPGPMLRGSVSRIGHPITRVDIGVELGPCLGLDSSRRRCGRMGLPQLGPVRSGRP